MIELERIGFGGGCHWCTEAVFQALRGVARVDQGFIAATPPDDSFSEAVIVHYDSGIIALETLVEIHLRTHSSMSSHKLRGKYRSAVYVFDEQQEQQTLRNLSAIQMDFAAPLVTRVLRFRPLERQIRVIRIITPWDPIDRFAKPISTRNWRS